MITSRSSRRAGSTPVRSCCRCAPVQRASRSSAAIDVGLPRLVIVPVALAYESRGLVGSEVAVRFGAPIEMDDWVERGRADPVVTARELTDLLQERLGDALALGTAQIDVTGVDPTADRSRRMAQLALLAPIAATGVAANATAILPIALGARFVGHEGWQATAKAVGATILLPVSWIVGGHLLARRYGGTRAAMLLSAGAGSGWVSLAWLGLMRDMMGPRERRVRRVDTSTSVTRTG